MHTSDKEYIAVNPAIKELIVRYWDGSIDESEAGRLAAWVSMDARNADAFRAELAILDESNCTTAQAVAFADSFIAKRPAKSHFRRHFTRAAIAAASCAAVALALVLLKPVANEPVHEEGTELMADNMSRSQYVPTARETSSASARESLKYDTQDNQKQEFDLPDGSHVTLNRGSVLKLDQDFGEKTRIVTLDGEGWFDVAKDAEHPFYIHCGSNTYIVRGTTFNISSYSNDPYTVVTLHTGALEAHVNNDVMMLSPGEELRVDQSSKNVTKLKVDVSSSTDWMNDILRFDSLPLKYVAAKLSHKYGAKINVHTSASDILYNGTIEDESLETALKLISITSPEPLKITNIEGEYYISKYNRQ